MNKNKQERKTSLNWVIRGLCDIFKVIGIYYIRVNLCP